MSLGDLLGEVRESRKKLIDLKKKAKKKDKKKKRKKKGRAKKIFSILDTVIETANNIEKDGVDIGDLVQIGGDLVKDNIKNEKVKDVIDTAQDVLEDGKVDEQDLLQHGGDLIKDNIKNEKVKDVIDTAQDVLEDGKVDEQDLLQHGGDLIKDNIKNETVKDVIDTAQDVLEDGKIDKDEIIQQGGDLIKDNIKNETVKDVIDTAQDVLEDGKIDKDEIIQQGGDLIKDNIKNDRIKDTITAIQEALEDGKVDAAEILGVPAAFFKKEIEKAGLTDIILQTQDILKGVTTFDQLLEKAKQLAIELAKEAAKKLIDKFILDHLKGGFSKELVRIKYQPKRKKWGRLSMGASFEVGLTGEIKADFKDDALQVQTKMLGDTYATGDLTLDVGFTIPVIDKRVEGEVKIETKGNLDCVADATIDLKLDIEKARFSAELHPATVITEYDITAYLTIPEWITDLWNGAAEWSFGYLDPIDGTFSKKIGKHKLFEITTPGHELGIEIKGFKFTSKSKGSFDIKKGAELEAMIKKVETYLPW
ncbi:MAG: hypothetical protein MK212_14070 [Saprospiraceae bacterium]|nr:hypothetical protein [Saprospiraceae bacterium]